MCSKFSLNSKFYILNSHNKGQALIEILVATAIVAIVVVSGVLAISTAINLQKKTKDAAVAGQLLIKGQEAIKVIAEQNWPYYISTTTPGINYRVATSQGGWILQQGKETIIVNMATFTRYMMFDDVKRDASSDVISDSGYVDPSTKKLTTYVTTTSGLILQASEYLTRFRNESWTDTDWSGGGSGATGGAIDSTYRYAWTENAGWIDFGTGQGNVLVYDEYLTGYAWEENIGWISLNCANDDSCDSVDYKVANDGDGHLSGYAWSENAGWINFGLFASSTVIDTTTGVFSGWAWGENIGWLSFNCSNTDSCGSVEYYVKTAWKLGGGESATLVTTVPINTFTTSTNISYNATSGEIGITNVGGGFGGDYGNIDSIDRWAWSDEIGWINFGADNVIVTSTKLQGYATSSIGEISLDCKTSPNGDICGASNYFVSYDGSGNLAGWAWNDNIGWISFCGNSSAGYSTYNGTTWVCPSSPTYQVTIDSSGYFHNWAWSDEIGWVSFNCLEPNLCPPAGPSDYKVKVNWIQAGSNATGTLMSHIYDIGMNTDGVVLNSVIWQGTALCTGCKVWFRFASATSSISGPWEDINFLGPYGNSTSWYGGAVTPGTQIKIRRQDYNNKRYFRYKIMLEASTDGAQTPVVTDVILNWIR